AEIYRRVFRHLKPRTPAPEIEVEFRRYANANSSIRLENGRLTVRIADILEGAPAPIMEALAYILLGKLYRRPAARVYEHRYRMYLNRGAGRKKFHFWGQPGGRRRIAPPEAGG